MLAIRTREVNIKRISASVPTSAIVDEVRELFNAFDSLLSALHSFLVHMNGISPFDVTCMRSPIPSWLHSSWETKGHPMAHLKLSMNYSFRTFFFIQTYFRYRPTVSL
jgi:hypothetical protein